MRGSRSVGRQFVVMATIYLMVALALGFVMGMTGDHSLFSVHSHLGLLGWTTMGLAGVVYLILPGCARSPLARIHFWLHNLGLPIMMAALTAEVRWSAPVQPLVGLGSLLVVLALLAFTVNVIRNGRPAPAAEERPAPAIAR
jgi:hypothetical protein